jgi:hypothetical protein
MEILEREKRRRLRRITLIFLDIWMKIFLKVIRNKSQKFNKNKVST